VNKFQIFELIRRHVLISLEKLLCTRLLTVQCNTLHGTEYKLTCGVCVHTLAQVLGPNTVKDRGLVPMGHQ